MKTSFKWRPGELQANLRSLPQRVRDHVAAQVDYHAALGEQRMKMEASWTDRTGAARVGLYTVTIHTQERHVIIFAHTVFYGIWLEVAHGQQYAIIIPTMLPIGDQLMRSLERMFREM